MFAWFRKLCSGGQIPEPPEDDLLDFPEEEEWVFDFDAWKWRAQERPRDPDPVIEDGVEVVELQVGVHESVPESRCCGGQCKLNQSE